MRTILVVDDEHDILLVVDLLLSEANFNVVKASNGKEALARLAEIRPELVLMDVMMPVMGGLDTLKVIKADPEYKTIPVILMSALPPRISQQEYKWDGFLQKPFEIHELMSTIERVTGGKKSDEK
ncbi:MAG: response regulator [Bdellovibrionota bacterium]